MMTETFKVELQTIDNGVLIFHSDFGMHYEKDMKSALKFVEDLAKQKSVWKGS